MLEIEVQNESDQTQRTLRFVTVPRIGEGVRLLDRNGFWTSYDVLDVWYQRSAFGDIWMPYIHVRKTEDVAPPFPPNETPDTAPAVGIEGEPSPAENHAQ